MHCEPELSLPHTFVLTAKIRNAQTYVVKIRYMYIVQQSEFHIARKVSRPRQRLSGCRQLKSLGKEHGEAFSAADVSQNLNSQLLGKRKKRIYKPSLNIHVQQRVRLYVRS